MSRWIWIFLATIASEFALAARILVFYPMPWRSHAFVYHSVIRALAERGHQIDFITAVPLKNPPGNVKQFFVTDTAEESMGRLNVEDIKDIPVWEAVAMYRDEITSLHRHFYENEPVIRALLASNDSYDAVIAEFPFDQEINSIWMHKFKTVGIGLLSLGDSAWANEFTGLPNNPAYMVDCLAESTDRMSFYGRLSNTINHIMSMLVNSYKLRDMQVLADELAQYPGWESRPPLVQLTSDVALFLVNHHHAAGYPSPKAPHVKEVGGLTIGGSTALPQYLKTFLDDATHGAVFISFGSLVNVDNLMKRKNFDNILEMFRARKEKFLFKWNGDNMPAINDSKIIVHNWFPQLGILAHRNTRVFVTHGGLQSTLEAIHFAVPLVVVPIFGDQLKNAKFIESAGIGVVVDKFNITRSSLEWALDEVVLHDRYKEAIEQRSLLLKDSPLKPIDEAVYWIEYVLRHGKVLQPASARMPFYQLYLLDVASFFLITFLLTIFVARYIFILLLSAVFSKKPVAHTKSTKRD